MSDGREQETSAGTSDEERADQAEGPTPPPSAESDEHPHDGEEENASARDGGDRESSPLRTEDGPNGGTTAEPAASGEAAGQNATEPCEHNDSDPPAADAESSTTEASGTETGAEEEDAASDSGPGEEPAEGADGSEAEQASSPGAEAREEEATTPDGAIARSSDGPPDEKEREDTKDEAEERGEQAREEEPTEDRGDDGDDREEPAAQGDVAERVAERDDAREEETTTPDERVLETEEETTARIRSEPPRSSTAADQSRAAGQIRTRYFGMTNVGLIRDHNEDNFVVADLTTDVRDLPDSEIQEQQVGSAGALFAVCDGMGGAAAGEVASQMAVDTLYDVLKGEEPPRDRDEFARRLVHAVEEAGSRIFSAAKMDRTRRGMGTTATVAGLIDKVLFVGQVGDSRAYVLRQGTLGLITKDQSLVNQLIEAGQLSEDEAEAFEHSNIILQALGTTEEVSVDLTFLELRRGDRLMLCSDGLSGLVHDELIKDVLENIRDPRAACQQLIEMANNGGGHDNVTVVLVDFEGDALPLPEDEVTPAYHQYPLPLVSDEEDEESITRREPSIKIRTGRPKPGAEAKPSHMGREPEGGRAFRWWAIALILLLAVGAAITLFGDRRAGVADPPKRDPDVAQATPPARQADPPQTEERVEVRVRTDVTGGELFVDGESYGQLDGAEDSYLRLSPGAYRFEARSGGSVVASANLTVRPGEPTDVMLMMPAGEEGLPGEGESSAPDDGAGTEPPPEPGAASDTAAGGEPTPRPTSRRPPAEKGTSTGTSRDGAETTKPPRDETRPTAGAPSGSEGRTPSETDEGAASGGGDSTAPPPPQKTGSGSAGSGSSGTSGATPGGTGPRTSGDRGAGSTEPSGSGSEPSGEGTPPNPS